MADSLFQSTFGRAPELRAYAPGRLEFIGNHTDYNGGAVLGATVDRGVQAALAAGPSGRARMAGATGGEVVEVDLRGELQALTGENAWANYPLGVYWALREAGHPLPDGFSLAVESDLPAGAGLSSSAALELATALGLAGLGGASLDRAELARLARRAENAFVGMPCGILDQGVSAFGKRDHLVHIDCLGETFAQVPLPPGAHFWIFHSNMKHSLVESAYSERHAQCFEAFDRLKNVAPEAACLAHVDPALVRQCREQLGDARYRRALHVTEENRRVARVTEELRGDARLEQVGEQLDASHRSSSELFENSTAELDCLAQALQAEDAVYGARLTGGGFGGAVMALTDATFGRNGEDARVAQAYQDRFGREATVYHTTVGDGAKIVG